MAMASDGGLSYNDLMNTPIDEWIEIRNTVMRISRERAAKMKSGR